VRQLAIRHKWPRRRPNANPYGRVEIAIPADFEARPRPTVQHPSERLSDTRSNGEVDAWRDRAERAEMVADLERERADQAEKRADAADADRRVTMAMIDSFAVQADRAEQGRDAERARADVLRDRIEAMQVDAASLQAQLATAEAEGDALTIETAELTAQVKAAKAEAREVQDRAAEALRQADAARRGRGRLARLRAAWRGE
jgi:chromosome segregation ATPase